MWLAFRLVIFHKNDQLETDSRPFGSDFWPAAQDKGACDVWYADAERSAGEGEQPPPDDSSVRTGAAIE